MENYDVSSFKQNRVYSRTTYSQQNNQYHYSNSNSNQGFRSHRIHQNINVQQQAQEEEEDWDRELSENQSKPKSNYSSSVSVKPIFQEKQSVINFSREFLVEKAPREETSSCNFSVKRDDIPRIIGKSGRNIQHIEKQHNVRLQISSSQNDDISTINISGSDARSIEEAYQSVQNSVSYRPGSSKVSSFSSRTFTSNRNEQLQNENQRTIENKRTSASSKFYFRHSAAAGVEEDGYDEIFGSDDDQPTYHREQHKSQPLVNWIPETKVEITKKVDWMKMRRADLSNDMTKWQDFPDVKKNFYVELPEISELSDDEVLNIRQTKNNIVVSWFDSGAKEEYERTKNCQLTIPNPVVDFFQAFHNYPEILQEIVKQGFSEPSPIQCQAWPIALSGFDFIGIAQTGTGKTLAFLLPALIHIDNQSKIPTPSNGPKALILSPTRELAIQIHQEVQKYSYRGIRSVVIYGGSSRKQQITFCEQGVEIVIATPGRLNDLIMNKIIDVRSVTYLVLDEADRMLDMGFEPQIMKILLDIRPDRQTIMTSATWPEDVRRIATRYMRNPIQIYIGTLDLRTVKGVQQDIEIVTEDEKFGLLLNFIRQMKSDDKLIVFVDRKSTADMIASELIRKHVSCQSIHGDREQSDREQALDDLKSGAVNILIATDVASRGLDIHDVTVVLNYDLPKSMEDYVHRVGRTGRAGKTGYAISFVTRDNWATASRLIKILEEAEQNVPDELRAMASRFQALRDQKRDSLGDKNRYGVRQFANNSYRSFGFY